MVVDKEPVRGDSSDASGSEEQASYGHDKNRPPSSYHPGLSVLAVGLGNNKTTKSSRKWDLELSVGDIGECFGSRLRLSARYKIHYPGWVSRWDEWVVRERLRWSWQTSSDSAIIKINDPVEIWCSGNNVPGAWLEAKVRRVRPQKMPPGYGHQASRGEIVQRGHGQNWPPPNGACVDAPVMVVGTDGVARPFIRSSDGKEYDVGKVLSNGRNEWEARERIRLASRRPGTGEIARSLGRANSVASSLFFSSGRGRRERARATAPTLPGAALGGNPRSGTRKGGGCAVM